MAKKHWIHLKRGLSEDPKHRDAMGNRIWLFMHIIDRADWGTGIVYDWKDKDEADDMGLPWRTLQKQRQELEDLGYITCDKKMHGLSLIIHNWVDPRNYSGQVMNTRSSTQKSVLSESTQESTQKSVLKSTQESTQHPIADLGMPTSHSMINDHDEWMNDDLICQFLLRLPGYNQTNLKGDRAKIVSHDYSIEALQYLWEDAASVGDNPIGLFLYQIGQGMHSPRYLDLIEQRRREAEMSEQPARVQAPRAQPERVTIEPDASITQPLPSNKDLTPDLAWQTALGELQMEITRATFETWVKPTVLLSVNGTWKIGTPNSYAKEWLDNRLMSTVKRVLTGVVGESVQIEFVVVK